MKMTDEEARAWKRAYEEHREAERHRCMQPVTLANSVKPRERRHSLSGMSRGRR